MEEHGPQELGAHRPHRCKSREPRHRLCGGAGTAVDRGRRSRPLQDERWRQDLGAGPQDLREHGRDRRRDRSAESQRRDRLLLPAPAHLLHADQRRPGSGHPPLDRRRQDLDQGQHRPALRGTRPHRPLHLEEQSGNRVRERGGREPQGRHLPQLRQRRHLGETLRLQPGFDVLRRHLRRRIRRGSRLRPRRPHPGVRRRRQDVPRARPALHARRQPHHLGRSEQPEPPARRQRRRSVPQLRQGRHLDVLRKPAVGTVLRCRRRRVGALLQRLRRPAGQQLALRSLAHPFGPRHPQ